MITSYSTAEIRHERPEWKTCFAQVRPACLGPGLAGGACLESIQEAEITVNSHKMRLPRMRTQQVVFSNYGIWLCLMIEYVHVVLLIGSVMSMEAALDSGGNLHGTQLTYEPIQWWWIYEFCFMMVRTSNKHWTTNTPNNTQTGDLRTPIKHLCYFLRFGFCLQEICFRAAADRERPIHIWCFAVQILSSHTVEYSEICVYRTGHPAESSVFWAVYILTPFIVPPKVKCGHLKSQLVN